MALMVKVGKYWLNMERALYVLEKSDGNLVVSFPIDDADGLNWIELEGNDAVRLRNFLLTQEI